MNADALTPSKYIRAADFGASLPTFPTLTIADGGRIEALPSLKPGAREGDEEKKGVLYFTDEPEGRGWVINKTNRECLKGMFGNETDAWVGKRVTLMAMMIRVGPRTEPGVRIKGSPDIDSEIKVTVKLPKRKPETFTLIPTGPKRDTGPKPTEWDKFAAAAVQYLGVDAAALLEWARTEKAIDPAKATHAELSALYGGLNGGPDRALYDAFVARATGGDVAGGGDAGAGGE